MCDTDDPALQQILKYRKRLKAETEPEAVRHALKRIYELAPDRSILEQTQLLKVIQLHTSDARNGELARYLVKKLTGSDSGDRPSGCVAPSPTAASSDPPCCPASGASDRSNGIAKPNKPTTEKAAHKPKSEKPAASQAVVKQKPPPTNGVPPAAAAAGNGSLSFDQALKQTDSSCIRKKKKRKSDEPPSDAKPAKTKAPAAPQYDVPSLPALQLPATSARVDYKMLNAVEQAIDRRMPSAAAAHQPVKPVAPRHKSGAADQWGEQSAVRSHEHMRVFAGRRKGGLYKHVPSLFDLCMAVICANVDEIEDTGDVPFEILAPALERATPAQLHYIEQRNPYLIDSTNHLWKAYCVKEFARAVAQQQQQAEDTDDEPEWRDVYFTCVHERDQKLKQLSKKMGADQKQLEDTQRHAKIISDAPDPLSVRKKQAKFGTARRPGKPVADALALSQARRQMTDMSQGERRQHKPELVKESLRNDCGSVNMLHRAAEPTKRRNAKKAPMMAKTMQMFKKQKLRR